MIVLLRFLKSVFKHLGDLPRNSFGPGGAGGSTARLFRDRHRANKDKCRLRLRWPENEAPLQPLSRSDCSPARGRVGTESAQSGGGYLKSFDQRHKLGVCGVEANHERLSAGNPGDALSARSIRNSGSKAEQSKRAPAMLHFLRELPVLIPGLTLEGI